MYTADSKVTGASNCLFLSNKSNKDGGGIFFHVWKDISFCPIAFCFFHNNYSPKGSDALIEFTYNGNHQYERMFLNSFTTCTQNSLAESNNNPTPISNPIRWLP